MGGDSLSDLPGNPLSHSPGNSLSRFPVCSLSNLLSSSLSDSPSNSLSNLVGNPVGDSPGHSLSCLGGRPLGGTLNLARNYVNRLTMLDLEEKIGHFKVDLYYNFSLAQKYQPLNSKISNLLIFSYLSGLILPCLFDLEKVWAYLNGSGIRYLIQQAKAICLAVAKDTL